MDEIITTSVQQQIRIFETHEEFRNNVHRFMRLAKVKESGLVVFPELSGLLLVPPLAPGLKRSLLKVAERQVKKKPSLFDRMIGRMADSAADVMGGISKSLVDAIIEHESTLRDAYLTTFSGIAREYEMHIVGGSIYLPDSRDGQMHNTAYLFGPTGEVIGQQSKVSLSRADTLFCQPGMDGLKVLETEFGRLGILIGQDVLYPESGRILADGGALFAVSLLAATGRGEFLKAGQAFSARLEENVLLGAQSCLVGKNILGQSAGDYTGKSAILAPLDMTTRHSGVLGEVGTTVGESIVSASWDLKGLYELRNVAEESAFQIPADQAIRRQLRKLYGDEDEGEPSETLMPSEAAEELSLPAASETALFEEPLPSASDVELPVFAPDEALEAGPREEAVEAEEEEPGPESPSDEELEDLFDPIYEPSEEDAFDIDIPSAASPAEQTPTSETTGPVPQGNYVWGEPAADFAIDSEPATPLPEDIEIDSLSTIETGTEYTKDRELVDTTDLGPPADLDETPEEEDPPSEQEAADHRPDDEDDEGRRFGRFLSR